MIFGALLLTVAAALLLTTLLIAERTSRMPRSLVVEYLPLRGARVIDDAVLAGREKRAAAAALLDLAVRGRVRLITEPAPKRKRPTIAIEVADPGALGRDDLALLDALFAFSRGKRRRLSRYTGETAFRVRDLIRMSVSRLRRAGLLANDGVAGPLLLRAGMVVLLVVVAVALIAFLAGAHLLGVLAVGALALVVAEIVVAARILPRRFTAAATARRAHLDGLRQYMRLAEADRLRTLQSPLGAVGLPAGPEGDAVRLKLHERLLPYAVIFGMEREWTKVIAADYGALDADTLTGLAGVGQSAADILHAAGALGDIMDAVGAIGSVVDAAGSAFDLAGALDLFDWSP
ncbi:DUF2207 family protein [Leifsonia shinshuensis]|uniref:DUF2207 domain-containing protein n=1 Tax=Leifsonia shinshuensis TaxID=150026 RepID=A0A7G6YG14_9MICO|nr:DUF2207 domain-containing protein [Leifsonia shinshuensis]QNE37429.1 DUF2207 domain-containing protein [Leifsonia shinshuensis]